jgi:hypothetical protein
MISSSSMDLNSFLAWPASPDPPYQNLVVAGWPTVLIMWRTPWGGAEERVNEDARNCQKMLLLVANQLAELETENRSAGDAEGDADSEEGSKEGGEVPRKDGGGPKKEGEGPKEGVERPNEGVEKPEDG